MSGKMTKEDASRIQATQASGGKDMSSSGFAARAQSAGDRNNNVGGTAAQDTGAGDTGGGNAGQAGPNKK
ncbi:hypothetical protein EAF04_010123 [Stromatinia cepivora]|nr:hypothetical protein EAF04_010123 [Stromatinia cepivora]